jgi:ferredoxin
MTRDMVTIDEEKCNGCGSCVTGCPEGALQVIDNKARLVSGVLCDGLGACIGECPLGAITVEKKETGEYDEEKVMDNITALGENTLKAHLKHLEDHRQKELLGAALDYLKKRSIKVPEYAKAVPERRINTAGGCPGSQILDFTKDIGHTHSWEDKVKQPSALRQWPVQMHLVNPSAPYFKGADLLLAADCVAFSMGNFHSDYLNGKALAIACPKLDPDTEVYGQKLTLMIDETKIKTLTVMIMEVPCCHGLLHIAKQAAARAKRKVPIKAITISLKGGVINEEW